MHKFGNHTLVCLAVVIAEAVMLDVYAQSNIPSDIPDSQLRFSGSEICEPDRIDVPLALREASADDENEQPTLIQADEVESEPNVQIKLSGNAQMIQGNRGVYADQMTYNQQTRQATANGNVKFYTPRGDEIIADSLDIAVDTGIGSAQNARIKFADKATYYTNREHRNYLEDYSILAPFRNKPARNNLSQEGTQETEDTSDDIIHVRARATADTVEFEDGDYGRLYNATFSSCVAGNDGVVLFAKEIELDQVEGIGTAKSLTVKFKRIPLFYLPIASFPITNKRKSGFLFPQLRYEKTSGIVLIAPYYINIAPNRDATLTPKFLSKRGVQLYGEYRYLTQKSETQKSAGIVKAEVLPADRVFNDDRYAFTYQHKQDFNDKWDASIDFHKVSDTGYFRDFSGGFGDTALSYVPQRADLSYRNADIFFKASASAYQAVSSDVQLADNPYRRLPEFNLNLKPHELGAFKYGIDSAFTRFRHPHNAGRISGTRFRVKPYISLPINRIYGYLTPRISLQTINYSLDNRSGDNSPSVIVPIASINSGLFFERTFARKGSTFSQTLEPRLFYVNIPQQLEQRAFPSFDSGRGGNSSFNYIFRENRFFGGDRVGDTEQLTLGLTSRIINHDGQQKLKLSVGQIFFLEDRQLGLTATTAAETTKQSDFLSEITANVNKDWNIRGFTRIGSRSNDLEFAQISADYYHSHRRNASIGYSLTKDVSEQVNLQFKAPIARKWQIDMESKYAMLEKKIRDFEIGVTYDGCCWATKLLAERYADGVGGFKNRFTISLELGVMRRIRTHVDNPG